MSSISFPQKLDLAAYNIHISNTSHINPEEITSSVTAYTGAPTVNTRGEVIQGNNRSAALKAMWQSHPEQAAAYKQHLIDHAAEFGLPPPEAIEFMEQSAIIMWQMQYQIDENTGESHLPTEKYSNFALQLAAMYKGQTQRLTQSTLSRMLDLIQGKQERDLFSDNTEDNTPRTLAEAIREVLNIEYNGRNGSNVLGSDDAAGPARRQGSQTVPRRDQQGTRSDEQADNTGRTESVRDPEGNRGIQNALHEGAGIRQSERVSEEAEETVGRSLTKEEADDLLSLMEENAEISTEKELTEETWNETFDENNSIETPIGRVKMGEHQIIKFFEKNRSKEFGMVGPTLSNPDVIIEEKSEAKDGNSERPSSFLLIKTFNRNGKKIKFFASITVKQGGLEVSISSHYINRNKLERAMQEGLVLYTREALLPNSSEWRLAEHQEDDVPDLLPTQGSNSSASKGTTLHSENQAFRTENRTEAEENRTDTPSASNQDQTAAAESRLGIEIDSQTGTPVAGKPLAHTWAVSYNSGQLTREQLSRLEEKAKTLGGSYDFDMDTFNMPTEAAADTIGAMIDNEDMAKSILRRLTHPVLTRILDSLDHVISLFRGEKAKRAARLRKEIEQAIAAAATPSQRQSDGQTRHAFSGEKGAEAADRADVSIKKQVAYELSQKNKLGLTKDEVSRLIENLEDDSYPEDKLQQQIDDLCSKHGITEDQLEDIYDMDKVWHEAYRRIAGEVEARNAQKRIRMTEDERRSTLASETEDVPRHDQIVLRQSASGAESTGVRHSLREGSNDTLEEVNTRFNEQIDNFSQENADKTTFNLGYPSESLKLGGIAYKPIRLHGSKVMKKMKKHGFSVRELRNLPKAIAAPIAVFSNKEHDGNRSVLTELKTANGNFLVTIDLGKGTEADFDIVSSVFGKRGYGVATWINKGYMTWVNKEKALNYLHLSAPIAEASEKTELSSAAKVVENFENPKLSDENVDANKKFRLLEDDDPKEAMENEMAARVEDLSERLHTPVRIIRTEEEAASLPTDRQRRMKGSYDIATGEVTIVIPNNANIADVENTFLHEVVGHDGLRILFPTEEQLGNALDELYRVSSDPIRQAIDRMTAKYGGGEQARRTATEEYAADLAGRIGTDGFERMTAEEQTFWGRVKSTLQKALASLLSGLGIKSKRKWTDKDWAYILHESYKRKKNGGHPSPLDRADTIEMKRKTGYDAPASPRAAHSPSALPSGVSGFLSPQQQSQQQSQQSSLHADPLSRAARMAAESRQRAIDSDPAVKHIREHSDPSAPANLRYRLPEGAVTPSAQASASYDAACSSRLFKLDEAWHDYLVSVRHAITAIEAATGRKIPEWANPYMHALIKSSKDQADYDRCMRDVLDPMTKAVHAVMRTTGMSLKEVEFYLMAKHGLERNDKMRDRYAREAARKKYAAKRMQLESDHRKGNSSGTPCPTTSFRRWQPTAATTSPCTTMPWLMLRHAP